jgi:Tfp pilus assembly protein FimT
MELVVVLAIMSMLLGLSTAYFFSFKSGAALKIAAQDIVAALSQARSLAITTRDYHGVAFDDTQSEYFIFKKPDDATREIVSIHFKTKNGIIIESTTFDPDSHGAINKPTALFNPTGSGKGGSIFLKNAKGRYNTITVVSATGRVRVFNYKKE